MPTKTLNPWEYPALASERTMGLLWLLLALMVIAAAFTSSQPFYSVVGNHGTIDFSFKMSVIAVAFKVLGILAPCTRITQRWSLRRMRQVYERRGEKLRVRPTYRAAIFAGVILTAISQAIALILDHT